MSQRRAVDRAASYLHEVMCLIGNAQIATQREAVKILKEAAINL